MNLKFLVIFSGIVLLAFGCKFTPFVKYQFTDKDTDLPKFGKYSYLAGTNSVHRSAYDITRYDWKLKVYPEIKEIKGSMEIWMDITRAEDSLLFDVSKNFKIDSVRCKKPLKYKRKRHLMYAIFDENLEKDSQLELTIYYHGKPPNIIGEGSVIWKESAGETPWFSTQTEGVGVHHLFPCKDLLIDEPEEVFMEITVPEPLVTAANGKLLSTETNEEWTTTKWHVDNSINVYNISFNVGDFLKFTLPYKSVNGNTYDLEFYALKENEKAAREFYAQTPKVLRECEELFGEYPWWNDGLKFVESTFSAMEHQGCIAMGSDYYADWEDVNTTLIHEIAHEWWGNSITASDYSDIWLHEGFATFSEALVVERLFGYDHYLKYFRNTMYWDIMNKRPIQKTPNVRYTSWATYADGDIYPKGAMLMHTLRTQMEDDKLFFSILKDAQTEFKDTTISSDQFQEYFLAHSNADLEHFFSKLLRDSEPPKLQYTVFKNADKTKAEIRFKWHESVPKNYKMRIQFLADEKIIYLEPTHETQVISLDPKADFKMQPWRSGYFVSLPFNN